MAFLSFLANASRRLPTGLGRASSSQYKSASELREINPMPHLDNETLLLAFVAVTGLAVLLQAIILLAIFITVRKTAITLRDEAEDLRSSVLPIIYNTICSLDKTKIIDHRIRR